MLLSGIVGLLVMVRTLDFGVYWILAAIFLSIALAVPRLRPAGIVGCVILGVMLLWGVVQRVSNPPSQMELGRDQRGKPASPAAATVTFPLDQVMVEELRLAGGGAPFDFRGRVTNNSTDTRLKSVTFQLERRDCFTGALDPSGCEILWSDRQWVDIAVPPHENREFAIAIWAHGAATRARGTVKDQFKVVAAAAEPAR
jgi:hypothetical protein